jgi:hypothetical protein
LSSTGDADAGPTAMDRETESRSPVGEWRTCNAALCGNQARPAYDDVVSDMYLRGISLFILQLIPALMNKT